MTSLMQMLGASNRQLDLEPLGVIDIGSNSVRLVVYEGAVRAATPLFNEKVLCGLGRTVASNGHLGDEAIERTISALARFRAIARILKVKNLRAFATAAVRDALDGPDFILRAEAACGVHIDILSGAREAELAAHGIRMGFIDPDGMVGDLGGGSLELIDIGLDTNNEATTLPLGSLRLIDETGNKIDEAMLIADQHLCGINWLSKGQGRRFYAVGGTWRALAKLHMTQSKYPLRILQGYAITTREAIQFGEQIRRTKKIAALPGIEEIARARRDVLPYGALVLERLLKQVQPSEVIFSVHGVREGLLYDFLAPRERQKDPLISFCEDFARQRSRSLAHAWELCEWTDQVFTGGGPDETAVEKRLRHAACLLSDISWRAHPDYRGEQSLDKIAHAGMTGIDHAGRIFLALSVYFRHAGPDKTDLTGLPQSLISMLDRRAVKRARIVGAALRTAHMISIGMPKIIDETQIKYTDNEIVLILPRVHAALDGERLRRRLDVLASLLNRRASVQVTA